MVKWDLNGSYVDNSSKSQWAGALNVPYNPTIESQSDLINYYNTANEQGNDYSFTKGTDFGTVSIPSTDFGLVPIPPFVSEPQIKLTSNSGVRGYSCSASSVNGASTTSQPYEPFMAFDGYTSPTANFTAVNLKVCGMFNIMYSPDTAPDVV